MWWRLPTTQVHDSVASMHSQSERRLTLKMRDPYPNTTNGEGVITRFNFVLSDASQVTEAESALGLSLYIPVPSHRILGYQARAVVRVMTGVALLRRLQYTFCTRRPAKPVPVASSRHPR